MNQRINHTIRRLTTIFLVVSLIYACNKDKVSALVPQEPTKWELIGGNYKVYDTLGTHLYDLDIVHVPNPSEGLDSLRFEGFDSEFTFAEKQPNFLENPEYYVKIGSHDTLVDSQGNRWKLLISLDESFNNVWKSDTIRLSFRKTNINYWIEDAVPYYECFCKQIAVKQP